VIVAESPAFLESVANHPLVLPFVTCKGVERIDFSPIWADCVALEWDDGGFVFHRQDAGVYEVHTLFLPSAKEKHEKAEQALRHMFDGDAGLIVTQVAKDLPHVRRFAERHGFVWFGHQVAAWERDSGPVDVDYFELTERQYRERQGCQQQSQ
jgi:hypothetical protein